MNKGKCLNVFNTQLKTFVSEMTKVYPTLRELKIIRTKVNTLFMASDNIIIKAFNEFVVNKYESQIVNKNEDFFLNMDLSGTPLEEFNKLKAVYQQSTEGTKNTIWKYCILLTKLSKKYNNL